jgi:iron complex transport system ATP-binding protein
VGLTRDGRELLDGIDLTVGADERWVVLGANGSGKTSLLRIAGLALHPSRGRVEVLGGVLGATDVRRLRRRVGLASSAVADQLRATLTAADVVMTARYGALEPWWHTYDDEDRRRARACLERMDAAHLAAQAFGSLSSGERQRVLVARALLAEVGLLLLDEPMAGLDLGAREALVGSLGRLAADQGAPALLFVTHHVEEIPPGTTHALVLRAGRVLAAGELGETLTAPNLSAAFGLAVDVRHRDGRWSATAS